jgi:DNA-directed RNA polymerase specialized sigma24 family protein
VAEQPDLGVIVTDLDMGIGPSGIELLEVVRLRAPAIVRILATGSPLPQAQIEAILQGGLVHEFLAKPWRFGELSRRVRLHLASASGSASDSGSLASLGSKTMAMPEASCASAEAPSRHPFQAVIDEHWVSIYGFAYRMTLDRQRPWAVVEETFLRAYVGQHRMPAAHCVQAWLLRIANYVLAGILPKQPEVTFAGLDDTLRSEHTRTDLVTSPADPKRDFLQWDLKQGCLTSVINCLTPPLRAAFVLAHVARLPEAVAAEVAQVSLATYRVRLYRAREKVTSYLSPRCEHIDPRNPCRCPARVGVALRNGFIRSFGEVSLREPPFPFRRYGTGPDAADEPLRQVDAVYGHLPDPDPPPKLRERLASLLVSGAWDQVRSQVGHAYRSRDA